MQQLQLNTQQCCEQLLRHFEQGKQQENQEEEEEPQQKQEEQKQGEQEQQQQEGQVEEEECSPSLLLQHMFSKEVLMSLGLHLQEVLSGGPVVLVGEGGPSLLLLLGRM
jgi:hypothetical protein